MRTILTVALLLAACQGRSQVDLATLSSNQWQDDLSYLTEKVEKRFAGFTPELRNRFRTESEKIRTQIPSLSVNQRIMEFARLLALLQDGHTEVSVVGSEANFHRLPLILYYFGNELRIVAASAPYKALLGKRLTKIENHPVSEILENLKPYMNADNDREYITTAPTLMLMPEVLQTIGIVTDVDKIALTTSDDSGIEEKTNLAPITRNEYNKSEFVRVYPQPPLYLENAGKGNWFRFMPESSTMYVNIITLFNQDGQQPVKKLLVDMMKQFDQQKAKKLVVDFRLCRGGNYNNILPLIEEVKNRAELNQKGNFFVINGRLTFSAASVGTIYFKEQTQALVVGEVSRARPNWAENMESYKLPNSKLEFDCMEETRVHSKTLGTTKYIPVDIEIPRSFELYKAGRDEVMEYILSRSKP